MKNINIINRTIIIMFLIIAQPKALLTHKIDDECEILQNLDLTIKNAKGWVRVCAHNKIQLYLENTDTDGDTNEKYYEKVCKCITTNTDKLNTRENSKFRTVFDNFNKKNLK